MKVANRMSIKEQALAEVLEEKNAEVKEELKSLYRQKIETEMILKNISNKIEMLEAKVQEEEDALGK